MTTFSSSSISLRVRSIVELQFAPRSTVELEASGAVCNDKIQSAFGQNKESLRTSSKARLDVRRKLMFLAGDSAARGLDSSA